MSKVVITFGTFDVFHVGHLRLLERAKSMGGTLVVGVSTDELSYEKKRRFPVCNQYERLEIVKGLKCVSEVFFEESLALKEKYINTYEADVLVMGDDWRGRFDVFKNRCDVQYLPRTDSVSTTAIIEKIKYF